MKDVHDHRMRLERVTGQSDRSLVSATDGGYRVLLIADDPVDADTVREALADARDGPYAVEWVPRLSSDLERLTRSGVAAVLVDLGVPDRLGLVSVEQVLRAAPDVPILILSSLDHEDLARQAVQLGAENYLLRDDLDRQNLPRALRASIERKAWKRP